MLVAGLFTKQIKMEEFKKQITDLLWSYATKAHGAGSCGELGDSLMAIDCDSFSDIADELLKNFEPKKCMPDGIKSKEEHEEYLKAIGYEKYVKDLQHFKDSSVGLNVTDKPIGDLLSLFWQRTSDACPLECSEAEKQELEFKEWAKLVSWVLY